VRILFLTQVLPYPLDAGPKVRAYYVLRALAEAGHDVTLLSFVRAADGPEQIAHLAGFLDAVHTVPMRRSRLRDAGYLLASLAGSTPFLIGRDRVSAMADSVARLVRSAQPFAAVHADQLWMAPYALHARQHSPDPRPRLVLDQHNAVFQIPQRLAEHEANPLKRSLLAHEARHLARYEAATCAQFDRVVWVTEEDRRALERLQADPFQRANIVIPICVDPAAQPVIEPAASPFRVTFVGGLHWPPNAAGILWFAQEVWPQVRAAVPGAVLTVIGKEPPAALASLATADAGIAVTGYVVDPAPYLAETAAFVVPLHAGGGMRVKILDAWCWGLPVVSTAIGAEGIASQPGRDLLLADGVHEFAAAVIRLLTDRAAAQELRRQGRRTVETAYDWRTVYRAWLSVYPAPGATGG
jgi:glycosyltransferase involved in cell wall biosynthesis